MIRYTGECGIFAVESIPLWTRTRTHHIRVMI
jgi:hypothetical protein